MSTANSNEQLPRQVSAKFITYMKAFFSAEMWKTEKAAFPIFGILLILIGIGILIFTGNSSKSNVSLKNPDNKTNVSCNIIKYSLLWKIGSICLIFLGLFMFGYGTFLTTYILARRGYIEATAPSTNTPANPSANSLPHPLPVPNPPANSLPGPNQPAFEQNQPPFLGQGSQTYTPQYLVNPSGFQYRNDYIPQ